MNELDKIVNTSEQEWEELRHLENPEKPILEMNSFASASELVQLQVTLVSHSNLLVPCDDKFKNSLGALAALHRSMVHRGAATLTIAPYPRHHKAHSVRGGAYARDIEPKLFPNKKCYFQMQIRGSTLYFCLSARIFGKIVCSRVRWMYISMLYSASLFEVQASVRVYPYWFPHPKAARFANILKHHALNTPLENSRNEHVEQPDPTIPRYDKIVKNSGQLLNSLTELCANMGSSHTPPTDFKKRSFLETSDMAALVDVFRSN